MPRTFAAALAAALLLTACARPISHDPLRARADRAVVAAVHGAGRAAAHAGSGRFRVTLRLEATGETVDPLALDITTTGAFDGVRRELHSDLGAAIAAIEGSEADVPPGFDEPVQVVVDGATTYLRMPMLDELVGSSRWLVADGGAGLDKPLGPLGVSALGGGIGAVDPLPVLEALERASDIEELGSGDVEREPVRHLRAELDLSDALEGLGPMIAVPVELWIDEAGQVRRLVADLGGAAEVLGESTTTGNSADMAGSLSMTVELFDYGADLAIAMPGADEVLPIEVALRAMHDAFARAGAGAR